MPVYNEASTITQILDEILAFQHDQVDVELIIVESNSTDGTRALVEPYGKHARVTLVFQEVARGKGNAVREAFRWVRGDIILIQDGDTEYRIDDYPALLEPILNGRTDFVLGNRHVPGKPIREVPDYWMLSRVMNGAHWVLLTLFNVTYRTRLRDPFTMFKVFRTKCIEDVEFVADRFDFDWELMAKLVRRGFHPVEIPVSYEARGFHKGKKIRPFRDPPTWIAACFRFRFCRLTTPASSPVGEAIRAAA
jgi:glycosyltransferase involved in cell wall biosynthesis